MGAKLLPILLLAGLGVVAWREQRSGAWPPRPFRFVGVALGFSLLAGLAALSPGVAAAFGVAFVIALALGVGVPTSTSGAPTSSPAGRPLPGRFGGNLQ